MKEIRTERQSNAYRWLRSKKTHTLTATVDRQYMYLLLQDVLDDARVRVRFSVDVGYDRDARLLHVDGVQHRAQLLVKMT